MYPFQPNVLTAKTVRFQVFEQIGDPEEKSVVKLTAILIFNTLQVLYFGTDACQVLIGRKDLFKPVIFLDDGRQAKIFIKVKVFEDLNVNIVLRIFFICFHCSMLEIIGYHTFFERIRCFLSSILQNPAEKVSGKNSGISCPGRLSLPCLTEVAAVGIKWHIK